MKPLKVRGRTLNREGQVLICTPLVARTEDALAAELAAILPQRPDVIEWRVDFFSEIHQPRHVVDVAHNLRKVADTIPIIFTRRAAHEGGEPVLIDEDVVVALYETMCGSGAIDIIDYELSQTTENRERLRAASRAHDVAMIMSYHNFNSTPARAVLVEKIAEAARQGADIAKVAVMPQAPRDVLVLLEATLEASQRADIPVITMSMGTIGAMSRLCGGLFGSAMTFASGEHSSAPGQIPIEQLRVALATLAQASSGR